MNLHTYHSRTKNRTYWASGCEGCASAGYGYEAAETDSQMEAGMDSQMGAGMDSQMVAERVPERAADAGCVYAGCVDGADGDCGRSRCNRHMHLCID